MYLRCRIIEIPLEGPLSRCAALHPSTCGLSDLVFLEFRYCVAFGHHICEGIFSNFGIGMYVSQLLVSNSQCGRERNFLLFLSWRQNHRNRPCAPRDPIPGGPNFVLINIGRFYIFDVFSVRFSLVSASFCDFLRLVSAERLFRLFGIQMRLHVKSVEFKLLHFANSWIEFCSKSDLSLLF